MQVYLTSLGCRLNEAELQTWARQFNQAGCSIATRAEDAQLIVMNSCAVTQEAVRKSRHLVRRLKRNNPQAKLLMSGCYASLNTEQAAALLEVDLVVHNTEKDQVVEQGIDLLGQSANDSLPNDIENDPHTLFKLGKQRAFIKVQDGCRYQCTFCIVTIARGAEKSRTVTDIIEEINVLHDQGVQEIVLTGVHLGGYGSDINTDLTRLIETILVDTDIARIRLGSLEPWELNDGFYSVFENPRLMPHLHLPMQSGSDSVLQRMARRCKTTTFQTMVERMRADIADLNITTDIIAGFPGETESEWQQTLDFVETLKFGDIHIFPYSPRTGTRAAELPHQVEVAVRKSRARQLAERVRKDKINAMNRMLNQTVPVLWETEKRLDAQEHSVLFGYTPNYFRVGIKNNTSDLIHTNTITTVELAALSSQNDFLWTTPVD
ncbi:MAG: tRNA (N(6)-L-threonylcarbamoyladenosine(37)-C(2))-methylthiotransferase MtaB [Gammaproteobacteria bacterium]|nr:tRNA (N(6)-L-threonylcarbamoyladenosine(37)-C(2))-methylthiotransferase MtaB [Gammaproteobacteria bacterium]